MPSVKTMILIGGAVLAVLWLYTHNASVRSVIEGTPAAA